MQMAGWLTDDIECEYFAQFGSSGDLALEAAGVAFFDQSQSQCPVAVASALHQLETFVVHEFDVTNVQDIGIFFAHPRHLNKISEREGRDGGLR